MEMLMSLSLHFENTLMNKSNIESFFNNPHTKSVNTANGKSQVVNAQCQNAT